MLGAMLGVVRVHETQTCDTSRASCHRDSAFGTMLPQDVHGRVGHRVMEPAQLPALLIQQATRKTPLFRPHPNTAPRASGVAAARKRRESVAAALPRG